jgi:hypothetical protein
MRFCPFFSNVYLAEVNLADVYEALRTELELTGMRNLQVSGQPQARPPGEPASNYCSQIFRNITLPMAALKVHKTEIFFGFDFEICIISFLVM